MNASRLTHWASALFMCLLLTASSACNSPCKDVECNNGTCTGDGECQCDPGYEGEQCEITANAKFTGTYTMSAFCDSSGSPAAYSVTMAPVSGTTDAFTLTGLHGNATTLEASIASDGVAFSFNRQSIGQGQEIESVAGTISSDLATINLNYRIYLAGTDSILDRCFGTMRK